MPPTLESMLVDLPEDELRAMRDQARSALTRAQVEMDLIEQALAKRSKRRATPGGYGDTRDRVLQAFMDSGRNGSEIMGQPDVIAALREAGSTVGDGAIRAMVRRLAEERVLEQVGRSEYRLARPVTDYRAAAEQDMPVPPAPSEDGSEEW